MGKFVDVRTYGAKGDGAALDTAAIQQAIDAMEKGDTLVFSDGCFVTGTLALKSDITVLIEEGAEICGSRNIRHYRDCGFYHNEFIETVSLLYALDSENIHITGRGKIQLSGDAFCDFNALRLGAAIDPASLTKEHIEQTVVNPKQRPTQPIFFNNCRNIRIDGVRIFNSPSWTLVFSNCDGVHIEDIYMDNHPRIPNNDGIHCTSSRNVTVRNSTLLCGDDCFAATCITNWSGLSENIEISDCLLSSRSAAIRLGYRCSHVRNITIRNVTVLPSHRGVGIFAGDNGEVTQVHIENLRATTKIFSGEWWGNGEGFVICTKYTSGHIADITLKDCSFCEEQPALILGEAAAPIQNVQLQNCRFERHGGNAHPYYTGKIDVAPHAELYESPASSEDNLYVENGLVKLESH